MVYNTTLLGEFVVGFEHSVIYKDLELNTGSHYADMICRLC